VEDHLDALRRRRDGRGVADVAGDPLDVRLRRDPVEVLPAPGREAVEDADALAGGGERRDEVAPDEAGAAGDQVTRRG
jgi:hypothetical protein